MPLNHKISNLVQYIKELTQLRTKPVYSFKNYEQTLWINEIPEEKECHHGFNNETDDWLFVKKPKYPPVPLIPNGLKKWIVIDSNQKTIQLNNSIMSSTLEIDDEGDEIEEFEEVHLHDHPIIKEQFNNFQDSKWTTYKDEYDRVNKIQVLYDQLYGIYQNLQVNSESLELVLSVGLLQWKQNNKNLVERHLLTSEVELNFNKQDAEMIIVPSSKGLQFEYEEDMLLVEDRLSGEDHNSIKSLLNHYNADNSTKDNFEIILKSIVNALDSRGTYTASLDVPSRTSENPIISLSPAFILRKKSQKSFQNACDTVVEQLKEMEDSKIPKNLLNMFDYSYDKNDYPKESSAFQEAEEYYFPLPSNEEQNRIINTLNLKDSVLVQGPPGTGKTHTIANLTSHLLATGQRVLITSQTAKALSVLKAKLPVELQDLSVSLLGGDATSMKDLQSVVSTISSNKELFDLDEMAYTVEKKKTELKQLKQILNKTKTELMAIREKETYIQAFNPPYNGTAQQIAIQLNVESDLYDWYTTTINLDSSGTDSFLTREKELFSQFLNLMNTDLEVPEGYYDYLYPTVDPSINLKELSNNVYREQELESQYELIDIDETFQLQNILSALSESEIDLLQMELAIYETINKKILYATYPKLTKVVSDIFSNRGYIWEKVQENLTPHIAIIEELKNNFEPTLVSVEDVPTASLKKMTDDLMIHLKSDGKLGNFLFRPKVIKKYTPTLKKISYNGFPIKSEEDINRIHAYAQTKHAYECIEQLIIPQIIEEKPFIADLALPEYENVLAQLTAALEIHEWRINLLNQFPIFSADTFSEQMVDNLQNNIHVYIVKKKLKYESSLINNAITHMEALNWNNAHPLYSKILYALKERNSVALKAASIDYEHFQLITNWDHAVNNLSIEIKKFSPNLLMEIQSTYENPIWKHRIAIWSKAQYWKQMKNWVNEFSQINETELSNKYREIETEISKTITEIGSAKAWISMLSTMTDYQSKHLKAWAKSVRSIGKGTGKNAPRYIAEAQTHMEKCKDAIPAWIMPLNRVFENFEIRPNLFDIVIIDEASQSWHDAILLMYLAKKVIIVGDDKQISPGVVGVKVDDVQKLVHKYLTPIDFEFSSILNASNSFFDVADTMLNKRISLREHFRCMPEIIGFSNRISYTDSPLIPLRQYPANRLTPVISRYLPHGVREGGSNYATNEVEADEIVTEIQNCIANPRYKGKTIGVISLLGNSQARLIQSKLISTLGAEAMEERQIICGDAYAFQGDERDVIFLSMVASKGETRLTAQVTDSVRQRYNVAVSRAKDQLWVMHSISINDISNRDCLRYQLLTYILDPQKEEAIDNRKKCESKFEENVFDAIIAKGYRVIPQYEVAGFRIDFVVQGEQSQLAVECDGDFFHSSIEQRERDFFRERILQRTGWTFWRVFGSTYYSNPEKAHESLWAKLDEMQIKPYAEWATLTDSIDEKKLDFPLKNTVEAFNKSKLMDLESHDNMQLFADDTNDNKAFEQSIFDYNAPIENKSDPAPAFQSKKATVAIKERKKTLSSDEQTSLHFGDEVTTHNQVQQDIFGESEAFMYKEKLISEKFDAFISPKEPHKVYVLGTSQLETELSRIAPKFNSFTYLKNGNQHTQGESAWYVDMGTEIEPIITAKIANNLTINEQPISKKNTKPLNKFELKHEDDHLLTIIKEMIALGFEVIDYRHKSETLYVIGDEKLEKSLSTYQSHGLLFHRMKKGNKTTGFKPAWYAKIKK